jgi:hypothetical protein
MNEGENVIMVSWGDWILYVFGICMRFGVAFTNWFPLWGSFGRRWREREGPLPLLDVVQASSL